MLFRRRKPPGFWERVRTYIWPRRSFSRSIRYITKRVLRLTATPHAIAAGVAAGVFASWTPFIGFHFVMSFVIAYLIAGNMVAAAIGTSFGNPITFPFIWTSCYGLGTFILNQETVADRHINLVHLFRHLDIADLWQPVLKPMLVGAIPLGLLFAAIFYGVTYWGVNAFRTRRRLRMAARARERGQSAYADNQQTV